MDKKECGKGRRAGYPHPALHFTISLYKFSWNTGVKKRQTYFENSDAETRKLAKI